MPRGGDPERDPTGGGPPVPIPPPPPDTPPPPTMPDSPGPPPGPYGSPAATRPPPPSAPVDHTWDGIASGYKTELEDLALLWQQTIGFQVTIDEKTLRRMADAHVISSRDMGQWMWASGLLSDDLRGRIPWAAFGMDQSSYQRTLGDLQDAIERYTGTRPAFVTNPSAADPANAGWDKMIWAALVTGESQSGFTEQLLHDENVRSHYGWIKYGLDYDTFQQRKTDMRVTFGQDLSNDQAILQLQYLHQNQGSSREVTAPAPSGGQAPAPAISEVEVR